MTVIENEKGITKDISILAAREHELRNTPKYAEFLEGITVEYITGKYGHTFAVYSREGSPKLKDIHEPNVIVGMNGGRNPPCGDYLYQINEVLSAQEPHVDAFVTMYFPMQESQAKEKPMVLDPNAIFEELKSLDETLKLPDDRQLNLIGFCVSADSLIVALRRGITDFLKINSILLISPGTLTELGRKNARRMYALSGIKRIVPGPLLNRLNKHPGTETPPNILDIGATYEDTFHALDVYPADPGVTHTKVPYIYSVWTKKTDARVVVSELIDETTANEIQNEIRSYASTAEIGYGTLTGGHGASTQFENIPSYVAAIQHAISGGLKE